jgi:hypothetical protein
MLSSHVSLEGFSGAWYLRYVLVSSEVHFASTQEANMFQLDGTGEGLIFCGCA